MNAATLMKQYRQNELRRTLAVSYFCTFCLNNMRRYFSSYLCTQRTAMGKQNSRILFTGFPCLFACCTGNTCEFVKHIFTRTEREMEKVCEEGFACDTFGSDTFTELCAVIKLVFVSFSRVYLSPEKLESLISVPSITF